jgi:hypothetical protein
MEPGHSRHLKLTLAICLALLCFVVLVQTHLPETVELVQAIIRDVIEPWSGINKEMLEGD